MSFDGLDLGAILSGALATAGLLLVFLPFFSDSLDNPSTLKHRKKVRGLLWGIPILIFIASTLSTMVLLTQVKLVDLTVPSFWLLIALIWLVTLLSIFAVLVKRGKI